MLEAFNLLTGGSKSYFRCWTLTNIGECADIHLFRKSGWLGHAQSGLPRPGIVDASPCNDPVFDIIFWILHAVRVWFPCF